MALIPLDSESGLVLVLGVELGLELDSDSRLALDSVSEWTLATVSASG